MATTSRRAAPRKRGRAPGRAAASMLDRYLPHFDAVLRQRVVVPVPPAQTWTLLERLDFAQLLPPVGRAIEDMRAVPDFMLRIARQALRVSPDARFLLQDAARYGFILLEGKPGRHVLLGAVGKLWKSRIELVPVGRDEFVAFDDPKYVKLLTGFLVKPFGTARSNFRHETRFRATDDTARAHFQRTWEETEPYVTFFLRQVMKTVVGVAKEHRATPIPPWRQPRS
ncbi:MAG TPA: hypothetical protein VGA78_18330 [Gemmatimonadales bacterium]